MAIKQLHTAAVESAEALKIIGKELAGNGLKVKEAKVVSDKELLFVVGTKKVSFTLPVKAKLTDGSFSLEVDLTERVQRALSDASKFKKYTVDAKTGKDNSQGGFAVSQDFASAAMFAELASTVVEAVEGAARSLQDSFFTRKRSETLRNDRQPRSIR